MHGHAASPQPALHGTLDGIVAAPLRKQGTVNVDAVKPAVIRHRNLVAVFRHKNNSQPSFSHIGEHLIFCNLSIADRYA